MTNGNSYFEQTKRGHLALLPRLGAYTDGRGVKEKKVAGLFQVALSVSFRTRPYGIAAFAGEVVVKKKKKKKIQSWR